MSWLSLAIISAISFAITATLQRALLKEEQSDPVAYAFVFQLIVAVIILIYALLTDFYIPPLGPLIPFLILMSLLFAFGNFFLFRAFQSTEASEVAVIASSKSIWTIITAILFLHEVFSINHLVGALLIIFGVVIISWKKGKWKLSKGHLYALLASIFFGVGFTNNAYLVTEFKSVPTYMSLAFLLPAITVLLIKPSSINNVKLFYNKKRLLKMTIMSLFYSISVVAIYLAYQTGGNASQLAPISQSSIILTVLLAYVFLKERNNMLKKGLGMILVFAGVLFLK